MHPPYERFLAVLDGELGVAESSELKRHIAGCAECDARWKLLAGGSKLVAEYHMAVLDRATPAATRKRRWIPLGLAACAAAALLLLWTWRPSRVKLVKPVPVVDTTKQEAPVERSLPIAIQPKVVVASHKKRVKVPVEEEVFLPLPYSDPALPVDDSVVLRVELTAEALSAAGAPVMNAQIGEPILADVLFGLDGQPRAIRFIR